MTFYIYKVVLHNGDSWQAVSSSFNDAANAACKSFNCPLRSIKLVEIVEVID